MESSLLKSDSEHVYFSRVIYPADSLSDFNNHFHTIVCGTKTTQNGLEFVQVLYHACEL